MKLNKQQRDQSKSNLLEPVLPARDSSPLTARTNIWSVSVVDVIFHIVKLIYCSRTHIAGAFTTTVRAYRKRMFANIERRRHRKAEAMASMKSLGYIMMNCTSADSTMSSNNWPPHDGFMLCWTF
jgi:hypothetical protein